MKDLRQRLRDRSAVLQGVVAPIALSIIVGVAFGAGGPTFDMDLAVVDQDESAISTVVVDGLSASVADDDFITVVVHPDRDTAADALDDGDVGAVLVLPAGYGEQVASGETPALEVMVDPARNTAGTIGVAFADGVTAQVRAVSLGLGTAAAAAEQRGVDQAPADPSQIVVATAVEERLLGGDYTPITFFAPSMAILFLFFTLGSSAQSMLTERTEGTLARMLSAPVGPDAILVGKTGSVLVLGLVSLVTVYAVTELAFDAGWGDPIGVLAVIVGSVVAIAGVSVLVTGLARTDSQANGITSMVAFGFAILGGNFIGPGDLPRFIEVGRFVTPNGWALSSFTELSAGDASVGQVALGVTVLVLMGLVAGGAGVLVLRRRMIS